MDYFISWWEIYFRREAKVAAQKAAKKIKPDEWPLIMEDTKRRVKYYDYNKTDKKHRPLGASYLNGRRWEDEYDDPPVQNDKNNEANEFISLAKNKWNSTFPNEASPIIKAAFFRARRHWRDWQMLAQENPDMARDEILRHLNNEPYTDRKMKAAGDE